MNLLSGVCCECGRVHAVEGVWVRLPVAGQLQTVITVADGVRVEYQVSHGYCPACEARRLLDLLRAQRGVVP